MDNISKSISKSISKFGSKSNSNSKSNGNSNGKSAGIEDDPAKHPWVLFIVAFAGLAFVLYAMYKFMSNKYGIVVSGSSYYGTDIATYTPIFKSVETNIKNCIEKCDKDISCDGVTFNTYTSECYGTKEGISRTEGSNLLSWIKDPNETTPFDIKKSILVGYTEKDIKIKTDKIADPLIIGNFCFSVCINIYDFYVNQGKWRHIFHKGEKPDVTNLDYSSWETIVGDIPEQCIGVWLAPFNNTLRIAINTLVSGNKNNGYYNDAMALNCDDLKYGGNCYITDLPGSKWSDKNKNGDGSPIKPRIYRNLEYIDHDLQNIPINRPFVLTVNGNGRHVELYINGKLTKTIELEGLPDWRTGSPLYVMNRTSFSGYVSNLCYFPKTLTLSEIDSIVETAQFADSNITFNPDEKHIN
jgi:hypothetical protein